MAKVVVLGATGPTGRLVVDQALQQGHDVTAFVRDPARLPVQHARLRAVVGDVTANAESLKQAMQGQDAVISALGVGPSFKSGNLIARSVPHIVSAMQSASVRRLIFTSAFGVADTWADTPFVPRIFIRTLLRDVYADKRAGDAIVRASNLEWTLVSPTGLSNRPAARNYRVGERLELRGFPTVSRADVAHFLLEQIADRTYLHKEVLITS